MRFINKPPAPQLTATSVDAYASALGNAVGRFCSFCEKALTYQLQLFHKQQGVLPPTATLGATDWADILLICGDCAANVTGFDAQTSYFWPDTTDAQQNPYLYTKVDTVAVTNQDPNGAALSEATESMVLVSISTDVTAQIQTNATNTYNLFQLNGAFFNGDFGKTACTFPYAEYVHPSDARLSQRMDAWLRAVEAAGALANGIPTIPIEPSYVSNTLALIRLAIHSFGFWSTWE